MHLNDLTNDNRTRLRKANKYLKSEFGIVISEDSTLTGLYTLKEEIESHNGRIQMTKSKKH